MYRWWTDDFKWKSIFRKKASPGRGKLSPQVTDEGAGKQQFAGNSPSSVCSLRSQPPSPQGVKAFAPGQAAKVDFYKNRTFPLDRSGSFWYQ
ncbi:hypothetical protein DXB44_07985 [Faecalibacterium sp. OM04-11BH]|nr:hypothetical protein DXB44_07985 [Faecalibacterium sp. OM04-11BH]